ncbi:hypothetical protein ACTQ3M_01085 [Oscillospiraceae bacterium LCP25S3_E10]|nr:hypothetical protein [Ruminococcus sp.]MDD6446614.1 hypothetical protein [Ruminococcus sp.]MDY2856159.1 hypothetical protein [Oscillospiraceae bacterium]
MSEIGTVVKKIALASIGAAAYTAEESREIFDKLVSKGTAELMKTSVNNRELSYNGNRKESKTTAQNSTSDAPKSNCKESKATAQNSMPESSESPKGASGSE